MERTFKIWRGEKEYGGFIAYSVKIEEGMVVLDALHRIQAEYASDLAIVSGGSYELFLDSETLFENIELLLGN